MNSRHSILVAYDHEGLRPALNVVEALEPIAEVQLYSYEQSREQLTDEPDVALCIVTDKQSLDLAHQCQTRLEHVPTFVVDAFGDMKIEVNGYAGRLSSSPDQVAKAVRQHFVTRERAESRPRRRITPSRPPRRISSPFDHTLARAAGGNQTPEAVLNAAVRQLAWDLRADRVEAFLRLADNNGFRNVCTKPDSAGVENRPASSEVIRFIKKRCYPMTADELESRAARPLYHYLTSRNLNLIIPLTKDSCLLGWLAFNLEASRCTDELLDDLQVVGHLLAISVSEAHKREVELHEAKSLRNAFSALRSGILTVDQEGNIISAFGATGLLGGDPQKGDSFKTIHNSRVREIIARALQGESIERSWVDFASSETIVAHSTKLTDGQTALFWGPAKFQRQNEETSGISVAGLELKEVLDSLPVPVLLDNEVTPGSVACPEGRITEADFQAIRDCALQAQAKNIKALRLRWGKRQSPENAVLFYEADTHEGSAEFADDIRHAVRFSLEAA
jgi:PAS domain-containing protein